MHTQLKTKPWTNFSYCFLQACSSAAEFIWKIKKSYNQAWMNEWMREKYCSLVYKKLWWHRIIVLEVRERIHCGLGQSEKGWGLTFLQFSAITSGSCYQVEFYETQTLSDKLKLFKTYIPEINTRFFLFSAKETKDWLDRKFTLGVMRDWKINLGWLMERKVLKYYYINTK